MNECVAIIVVVVIASHLNPSVNYLYIHEMKGIRQREIQSKQREREAKNDTHTHRTMLRKKRMKAFCV